MTTQDIDFKKTLAFCLECEKRINDYVEQMKIDRKILFECWNISEKDVINEKKRNENTNSR